MGAETKEETTLDLNQVMEEGMDQFQGELEEAAREEGGGQRTEDGGQKPDTDLKSETTITPKSTDEASPPGGQKSGVRSQESGEETKTTDDKAGTETEKETPEEKAKDFRFKSQDEAESGYRNLQAAKTRVEQEAARLRAELKTAQDAEKIKQDREVQDKELFEFVADRHEKALSAIDDLDPDNEEYRKQVSRIWAEKDRDIEVKRRDLVVVESQPPQQEENGGGWESVTAQAEAAGIDADDEYFRMICANAPDQDGAGKPIEFKDQVSWAITQTTEYQQKQERLFQERQKEAAARKSEEHQDENLTLARSPADRTAIKPDKTPVVTLNDALESALEERRL